MVAPPSPLRLSRLSYLDVWMFQWKCCLLNDHFSAFQGCLDPWRLFPVPDFLKLVLLAISSNLETSLTLPLKWFILVPLVLLIRTFRKRHCAGLVTLYGRFFMFCFCFGCKHETAILCFVRNYKINSCQATGHVLACFYRTRWCFLQLIIYSKECALSPKVVIITVDIVLFSGHLFSQDLAGWVFY